MPPGADGSSKGKAEETRVAVGSRMVKLDFKKGNGQDEELSFRSYLLEQSDGLIKEIRFSPNDHCYVVFYIQDTMWTPNVEHIADKLMGKRIEYLKTIINAYQKNRLNYTRNFALNYINQCLDTGFGLEYFEFENFSRANEWAQPRKWKQGDVIRVENRIKITRKELNEDALHVYGKDDWLFSHYLYSPKKMGLAEKHSRSARQRLLFGGPIKKEDNWEFDKYMNENVRLEKLNPVEEYAPSGKEKICHFMGQHENGLCREFRIRYTDEMINYDWPEWDVLHDTVKAMVLRRKEKSEHALMWSFITEQINIGNAKYLYALFRQGPGAVARFEKENTAEYLDVWNRPGSIEKFGRFFIQTFHSEVDNPVSKTEKEPSHQSGLDFIKKFQKDDSSNNDSPDTKFSSRPFTEDDLFPGKCSGSGNVKTSEAEQGGVSKAFEQTEDVQCEHSAEESSSRPEQVLKKEAPKAVVIGKIAKTRQGVSEPVVDTSKALKMEMTDKLAESFPPLQPSPAAAKPKTEVSKDVVMIKKAEEVEPAVLTAKPVLSYAKVAEKAVKPDMDSRGATNKPAVNVSTPSESLKGGSSARTSFSEDESQWKQVGLKTNESVQQRFAPRNDGHQQDGSNSSDRIGSWSGHRSGRRKQQGDAYSCGHGSQNGKDHQNNQNVTEMKETKQKQASVQLNVMKDKSSAAQIHQFSLPGRKTNILTSEGSRESNESGSSASTKFGHSQKLAGHEKKFGGKNGKNATAIDASTTSVNKKNGKEGPSQPPNADKNKSNEKKTQQSLPDAQQKQSDDSRPSAEAVSQNEQPSTSSPTAEEKNTKGKNAANSLPASSKKNAKSGTNQSPKSQPVAEKTKKDEIKPSQNLPTTQKKTVLTSLESEESDVPDSTVGESNAQLKRTDDAPPPNPVVKDQKKSTSSDVVKNGKDKKSANEIEKFDPDTKRTGSQSSEDSSSASQESDGPPKQTKTAIRKAKKAANQAAAQARLAAMKAASQQRLIPVEPAVEEAEEPKAEEQPLVEVKTKTSQSMDQIKMWAKDGKFIEAAVESTIENQDVRLSKSQKKRQRRRERLNYEDEDEAVKNSVPMTTIEMHFADDIGTQLVKNAIFIKMTDSNGCSTSIVPEVVQPAVRLDSEEPSNEHVIVHDYRPGVRSDEDGAEGFPPPADPVQIGAGQRQVASDLSVREVLMANPEKPFVERSSHQGFHDMYRRLKFLVDGHTNMAMHNEFQKRAMQKRLAKFEKAYLFRKRVAKMALHILDIDDGAELTGLGETSVVNLLLKFIEEPLDNENGQDLIGSQIDHITKHVGLPGSQESLIIHQGLRYLDLRCCEVEQCDPLYPKLNKICDAVCRSMKDQEGLGKIIQGKANFNGYMDY
ncbi:hypothetical protein L5515_017480 [Caenorhabditis briggsae]|uniref:Uncharacterized protein n=1 Tax=Caenorhabditis briggsae TaxID=6238 RepID=A0AAE9FFH7_CAEBR|nr:hypothetical protein L5515_017480 [Caenorhabditis briggsae]